MEVKVHKIYLLKEGSFPRRAQASIDLDGLFAVHGISIIETHDKQLKVVMPNKKLPNDTYADVAHPLTADFRKHISNVVLEAYQEALNQQEK